MQAFVLTAGWQFVSQTSLCFCGCCPRRRRLPTSYSSLSTSVSPAMSMSLLPSFSQQYLCPSSSSINPPRLTWKNCMTRCPPPTPLLNFSVKPSKTVICLSALQSQVAVGNGKPDTNISDRTEIRLGLPSKGRMADDTIALLKVIPFYFFVQR